jgi:O-antigen biosynthesis protein
LAKYSIIVPVFNQLDYTKFCVNSVIDMTQNYDYELIIVANGCTDKTEEWVLGRQKYCDKQIVLCSYKKPLGFGAAINAGMRLSLGEYLILLNNDCEIIPPVVPNQPSWIDMLEEPFKNPKVGITGPLIYPCEITRSLTLVFFCAMIHRKVIEKIGFLDAETFPIGAGEDSDFCARAQDAGFLLKQVPENTPYRIGGREHMVGLFPIYHIGEATLREVTNWEEQYLQHQEALKKKYGFTGPLGQTFKIKEVTE